ncbi:MAG: hypothetical protein D6814_05130 [Calditrichaeota bacterium]|nr:MAG: hypothetical protein D6814_05130 [Calditrichota bacterium]
MQTFGELSREELLKLVEVFAKNWLAHDGCWFLSAEEKYGMEAAIELDTASWRRFAVAEARRIMKAFNIPPNGGLRALEKALQYRLYAAINKQDIEWLDEHRMIFKMVECRVQKTRQQKGLPAFPCKSVGMVEFSQFAKTVDSRIQTRCISCPPDPVGSFYCGWEFTLQPDEKSP